MKKILKVLAVGVLALCAFVAMTFAGFLLFLRLLDTVVHLQNDTAGPVTAVLLLQNHDDGGFYLSHPLRIEPGESADMHLGFEALRCIYLDDGATTESRLFDKSLAERVTESPLANMYVNVSALRDSDALCPRDQEIFSEGAGQSIYLDAKWNPR